MDRHIDHQGKGAKKRQIPCVPNYMKQQDLDTIKVCGIEEILLKAGRNIMENK